MTSKEKGEPNNGILNIERINAELTLVSIIMSIALIIVSFVNGRTDSTPEQPQVIVQGDGNTVAIESL